MNDVQVIVGIPSYRNPAGLKKLLRELSLKEADLISRVVVVDNDAGEAATAAVRELRNDIPNLEVSVHLELQPGISNARNRIVAEALKHPFEFLAMLDDDEYPAGGWLRALLERAEETRADVISGPVRPMFECDPLEPILPDDYAKSGGRVTRSGVFIDSTANIMFSRRVLEAFEGAWFDLDFGMSLGHDAELLHRMQRAGFRQAIAPKALVFEDIPADRVQESWRLKRSYGGGNAYTRMRVKHHGRGKTILLETAAVAGLLLGMGLLVLKKPGRRTTHLNRVAIAQIRGKAAALRGTRYDQYAPKNYR